MNRYNPNQYMDKEHTRFQKEIAALTNEITQLQARKLELVKEIQALENKLVEAKVLKKENVVKPEKIKAAPEKKPVKKK